MTEKTLSAIELGVSATLSIGVDYVVNKVVSKAVDPQTIPEKIMTGIGVAGVSAACDYAIAKMVHGLLYPSETDELKALVEVTRQTIDDCGEISKVMVEHEVKIEDAVGDIYKSIMEGK